MPLLIGFEANHVPQGANYRELGVYWSQRRRSPSPSSSPSPQPIRQQYPSCTLEQASDCRSLRRRRPPLSQEPESQHLLDHTSQPLQLDLPDDL